MKSKIEREIMLLETQRYAKLLRLKKITLIIFQLSVSTIFNDRYKKYLINSKKYWELILKC